MSPCEKDINILRISHYQHVFVFERGVAEHQVDNFKPLPTATHSWDPKSGDVNVVVENGVLVRRELKAKDCMPNCCHWKRTISRNPQKCRECGTCMRVR